MSGPASLTVNVIAGVGSARVGSDRAGPGYAADRMHDESIPVGDPRRAALGRAVFGTLRLAGLFFLFAVPAKQFKGVYVHAPWLNDPFDTVYSFAMFFVPLVAALVIVQVSLCRKAEPLAAWRVRAVVRGCRVTVLVICATLLSCWSSVAVAANRAAWNTVSAILIAALALVTGFAVRIGARLWRLESLGARPAPALGAVDWLGDAVAVARRQAQWLGPLRANALAMLTWGERMLLVRLRRHPLWGAATAALVFALGAGINQGVREGYALSATVLTVALLTAGIYAFLVLIGAYLGLVASAAPLSGARRRLADGVVGGCVAAVLALAFRNSLWFVVGSKASAAGAAQFALLLALAVALGFAVVVTAEAAGGHIGTSEPDLTQR